MINCEAEISKEFRRTIKDADRLDCKREAKYRFNSKCYCAVHIGKILIDKALVDKVIIGV